MDDPGFKLLRGQRKFSFPKSVVIGLGATQILQIGTEFLHKVKAVGEWL